MSKKLRMRDAELIRVFAEFGFTPRQLAREYDVHADTVRNVVKGTSFKPGPHKGSPHANQRKLNPEQVRQIRTLAAEGHREQFIARKLGYVVRRGTVRQVIHGITYKDVP